MSRTVYRVTMLAFDSARASRGRLSSQRSSSQIWDYRRGGRRFLWTERASQPRRSAGCCREIHRVRRLPNYPMKLAVAVGARSWSAARWAAARSKGVEFRKGFETDEVQSSPIQHQNDKRPRQTRGISEQTGW